MAAKTASAAPALPGLAALGASSPSDRLRLLASHAGGISSEEALRRRRAYGANEPVRPERTRILATFAGNFTHTLALLLWFAAGLSFASGIPELGAAIVAVIGINGVFAFLQEHRAEQVLRSLMRQVAVQARALRGGSRSSASRPSTSCPAMSSASPPATSSPPTACCWRQTTLALDLSMITGESTPVERDARVVVVERDSERATDLACIAPSGSGVATGSGEGVVWATGPDSTMGQVAALVESVHRGESVRRAPGESAVATHRGHRRARRRRNALRRRAQHER